jgi:hypothetical protein
MGMAKLKDDHLITEEEITSKIYMIRGHKVMLDTDLAELYHVETKVFNQAVKRNTDRFPNDFMFQLKQKEWSELQKEFGGNEGWGGRRYMPFVFTEQGVAMLSGVLNSDVAVKVNIQIMRTFVKVRHVLSETMEIKLELEQIKKSLDKHSKAFEVVFDCLDELSDKVEEIEKKQTHDHRIKIGYKK